MRKHAVVLLVAVLVLSVALAGCSKKTEAPKFPTKPVEMTVLFGAGSSADLVARQLASAAEKVLGQPMPVVNRTGASGAVGYTYVKNTSPDGYNIVWNSNSISTAYYQGNMDFNYTAFDPVAKIATETVTLAVKADAPWKNLNEFLEYAKANPGKVKVGNSGLGSFTHLTAVAIAQAAGAELTHVPFGKGLAVASLLSGEIQASVQLPAEIMNQVKAGQVRILTVTTEKRIDALPDVPTLREQGHDLVLELWRGIAVPKGTPKEVIKILEDAFRKAVEDPKLKEMSQQLVFQLDFLPADEFGKFIAADDEKIAKLMEAVGQKKQ